ncbi:uncharacterized protein [Eucyclogobius newberryi]|uniref:uncharacterized protein isoform X2 n=1 Tax=Eucyclogobius newberryi TaxID=166745 RepID=UPI003B59E415
MRGRGFGKKLTRGAVGARNEVSHCPSAEPECEERVCGLTIKNVTQGKRKGPKRGRRTSDGTVYLGVRVKMTVRDMLNNVRITQGGSSEKLQDTFRNKEERVRTSSAVRAAKRRCLPKSLEELAIIVEVLEEDLKTPHTKSSSRPSVALWEAPGSPGHSPALTGYSSDGSEDIHSPHPHVSYPPWTDYFGAFSPDHQALSPDHQALSPDNQALSPHHQALSPHHQALSPDYQALSPHHQALSPHHQALSPDYQALSPHHQALSPDNQALSPHHQALSPHHQALSPDYQALSPHHQALSPDNQALSPHHQALSPHHQALSPDYQALSPHHQALSPDNQALSPHHQALSPHHQALSPDYQALSPDHQALSPSPDHMSCFVASLEEQYSWSSDSSAFFWTQLQKEEMVINDICDAELLAADEHGKNLLHNVVCVGKRALAYAIAKRMAAINSLDLKDLYGMTALHYAAKYNHHLMVCDLIQLGASINERNNMGKSCVHLCAEKGYTQVLEVLKQMMIDGYFVDVEATDNSGMSVLQCTAVALKATVCEGNSSSTLSSRLNSLHKEQMLETLEIVLQMGSYLHSMGCWGMPRSS